MKRRKGLASSSALDTDHSSVGKLKGDVYNIFPYIRDPDPKKQAFPMDRAFTLLSVFNAVFFPIIQESELERRVSHVKHELGHVILGSAMVSCEERALTAQLLGMVWNFLLDADNDVRLLIPSFTIVGPAGKVFKLKKLADRLEKLADAREAVHEIVACAKQVEREDFDRDKVKRLIRQVVADTLLGEKDLDGFLDVYEKFGPMAACSIGHYALNAVSLTQRSALARFKRATKVAGTFKPKDRDYTSPGDRLEGYLEFVQHLDSNLPDHNMARCPLIGFCLPNKLESWAVSLTNRSKEEGNPAPSRGKIEAAAVYLQSAVLMGESRCDHEEQHARENEILSASVQEILKWCDPEALSLGMDYEMGDPIQSIFWLALIEHNNDNYTYTIGIIDEEKNRPMVELSPAMFGLYSMEASLQQMMCGEGPLCLCYPHQPAECRYRPLLQRMWDCTEPDPEWECNWKQPEKKPRCIE